VVDMLLRTYETASGREHPDSVRYLPYIERMRLTTVGCLA